MLWNGDAHLRSTLIGSNQTFEVAGGRLEMNGLASIYLWTTTAPASAPAGEGRRHGGVNSPPQRSSSEGRGNAMLKMAPSFMSANLLNIQGELYALDPYADYYHVDIIDWHYVKNMCLTPQIIKAMSSATEVPIEAHLYVDTIDKV